MISFVAGLMVGSTLGMALMALLAAQEVIE